MAPIQAVSPTVSGSDLRLWRTVTAFIFERKIMKQPRLSLYLVDMKYIRNLAHADDHVMSVSPQVLSLIPLHPRYIRLKNLLCFADNTHTISCPSQGNIKLRLSLLGKALAMV